MKKREDGTFDFSDIDPEVHSEIQRGKARQARQRLSPDQRSRAARQKEIDARRNRRNIDIDPDLEHQVEDMADQLSVPFSQLLCRLAYEGLCTLDMQTLQNECQPSRSMRFYYTLPLPGKRRKTR